MTLYLFMITLLVTTQAAVLPNVNIDLLLKEAFGQAGYSNYASPPAQDGPVITRAVNLFFDAAKYNYFQDELKWFVGSWKEMIAMQADNIRTDLVISVSKTHVSDAIALFTKLGCGTTHRTDHNEAKPGPNLCIYDHTQDGVLDIYPKLKIYEKYSNSMFCLTNQKLGAYRYLLRSDTDAFLAPAFARFMPVGLHVGKAGYSSSMSMHRLATVAKWLDLSYTGSGVGPIGSTWYGPAKVVQLAALKTMEFMVHLLTKEFTPFELSPAYGTDGWPTWHYPVTLLYGGHLAVNHVCTLLDYRIIISDSNAANTNKDIIILDQGTDNTHVLCNIDSPIIHLHTWHSDARFSKFAVKKNPKVYNNIKIDTLDTSKCMDYATMVFLKWK